MCDSALFGAPSGSKWRDGVWAAGSVGPASEQGEVQGCPYSPDPPSKEGSVSCLARHAHSLPGGVWRGGPGDSGDGGSSANLQDTQQTLAGCFPTAIQSVAGI